MSASISSSVSKVSRSINKNKYITFFLDREEYGVDIHQIKEIIGIMDITPIPNTPAHIKGVLNLRGKIIPVIDLRLKFGMDFMEYQNRTSIIIIEVNFGDGKNPMMGIIVDTVSEVLQIDKDEIEETPYFGTNIDTDFILGMAKVDGKVKILLDVNKVLTTEEVKILKKMQKDENVEN